MTTTKYEKKSLSNSSKREDMENKWQNPEKKSLSNSSKREDMENKW